MTYPYRPAGGLTTAVIVLLFATMTLDVLLGFLSLYGADAYPAFATGQVDPTGPMIAWAMGVMVLAGLVLTALVATVVVFCVWMNRANKNARALGADEMQFTPGWAVGWWFIPFANLVMPYRAMREIHQASDPDGDEGAWTGSPVPSTLGAWWAFWLIGNFVSSISARMPDSAAVASAIVGLAGTAATVIAGVLLVGIVRDVHRRQEKKARRASGAQPAAFSGVGGWPTAA